jgi:hypothetical protein
MDKTFTDKASGKQAEAIVSLQDNRPESDPKMTNILTKWLRLLDFVILTV